MSRLKLPDAKHQHLGSKSFFDTSTSKEMKPYGDSIGFALDVIVVQPSLFACQENIGADDFPNENINRIQNIEHNTSGVFASSDFAVHFPDRSLSLSTKNHVIQIQINGRLLDESFLSMKLPKSSKINSPHELKMCEFNQGGSTKPPTTALQELVRQGLLHPGRNLLRYILTWRSIFIQQNDHRMHSNWVRAEAKGSTEAKDDGISTLGFADAHVYLWSVHDTVLISDIDGTLTKSNVKGLMDTVLTKKYSYMHDGVCSFFSNLVEFANDSTKSMTTPYDNFISPKMRILYLSSRPLRLINSTRKFLCLASQSKSIQSEYQNPIGLPPGPIFVHKGTFATVIKAELFLKSTHEFKADVLIRQVLLPFVAAGKKSVSTLFSAGFGNKSTDAMAYYMVGIEKSNIYLINRDSLLVSPHAKSKSSVDDEENSEGNLEIEGDHNPGGYELLDNTIFFGTWFQTKISGRMLCPTYISTHPNPTASLYVDSIKNVYKGYDDPLLINALQHKIQTEWFPDNTK